ncbi:aminotransferase class I/II-fold pyridoxal phosphate-dependent enzyme [Lentzea jiangxiensis]|uniref:aminotransferase class I/II-fold pyridoxal phosphate-dependent enzyme n=1 Tax=Lentzea jiangxiensis TaxID=641025 RepID=UPI000A90394D
MLSNAAVRSFPHNDPAALDRFLTRFRAQYRRALLVLEGVYSMDGDIPDLPAFVEVARARRHDHAGRGAQHRRARRHRAGAR